MSLLAIIPARGGSKGIPHKNIIDLNGKPLISYSINAALESSYIDRIVLSTDSLLISDKIDSSFDIDVDLRPENLATDQSLVIDTVLRLINIYKDYEEVILLQPTSPLRTSSDIDEMKLFQETKRADSVVSICKAQTSPEIIYRYGDDLKLEPILSFNNLKKRRQDFNTSFQLNGAMYLANIEWLKEKKSFISNDTLGFLMPLERSVDIDSFLDLRWAKFILDQRSI